MKYTVVGLWMDQDPPQRVAAHVEADNPELAVFFAQRGEGQDDLDLGEDFLLAGVFVGHLMAVDEQ